MNLLERFHAVMGFDTLVTPPKWEFGYWGQSYETWYEEGLRRRRYPRKPKRVSTPNSSLYTPCWSSVRPGRMPAGIAITGGGLYWPSQGFALDDDVRTELDMDISQILINVNLLFSPMFDVEIIEETEEKLLYVDIDGVKRIFSKQTGVIPTAVDNVIKDRASWNVLKDERLDIKNISERFPSNWGDLVKRYKNRDYPLVLGGYPQGYFGTLAHLMGYERLFYAYTDQAGLLHDIQNTFTEVWIAVYEEVLAATDVDMFIFWEDISAGSGSMVSPAMIREFMLPYYLRMTDFLKSRGVEVIFVDTDGDCADLIPLFIEGGVTGMYPIEASCGMDLRQVRNDFPELQLMGGIPKSELVKGPKRIDEILEPVADVLKTGGYIPFGDHLIPPEIHWPEFRYYRQKLNSLCERKI